MALKETYRVYDYGEGPKLYYYDHRGWIKELPPTTEFQCSRCNNTSTFEDFEGCKCVGDPYGPRLNNFTPHCAATDDRISNAKNNGWLRPFQDIPCALDYRIWCDWRRCAHCED